MGKAFASVRQSLNEAIGHAKGEHSVVKVWRAALLNLIDRDPAGRRGTFAPGVYLEVR